MTAGLVFSSDGKPLFEGGKALFAAAPAGCGCCDEDCCTATTETVDPEDVPDAGDVSFTADFRTGDDDNDPLGADELAIAGVTGGQVNWGVDGLGNVDSGPHTLVVGITSEFVRSNVVLDAFESIPWDAPTGYTNVSAIWILADVEANAEVTHRLELSDFSIALCGVGGYTTTEGGLGNGVADRYPDRLTDFAALAVDPIDISNGQSAARKITLTGECPTLVQIAFSMRLRSDTDPGSVSPDAHRVRVLVEGTPV